MAIANLLPAKGANDNRPSIKQFFGRNPAVANDNVERVSNDMFSNTFVDSVLTTVHGLIDEIAKITDIAKGVISSFSGIIKSLKGLNKDVTSRFRVLNNELNASRIDFIRTVLDIPKTEAPKMDGVPVNVNAPEAVKKDEKETDWMSMISGALNGLGLTKDFIKGLTSIASFFFTNPIGMALLAGAGITYLLYKGLDEMTKAIMSTPEFQKMQERDKGKTETQMQEEAVKNIGSKLSGGRTSGKNSVVELVKGNKWGDDGKELGPGDFDRLLNTDIDPAKGQRIAVLKKNKVLKDGTLAINLDTGEKYDIFDEASVNGNVVAGKKAAGTGTTTPTAPTLQPAQAPQAATGAPQAAGGPMTSSPAALGPAAAGTFGLGGATGTNAAPPTGAPTGQVQAESNTPAPPPNAGAPAGKATTTTPSVPAAGATGGGAGATGGGVAVVKNSNVKNIGSTGGAETNYMAGQNLPMFTRNPNIQDIFAKQLLPSHQ